MLSFRDVTPSSRRFLPIARLPHPHPVVGPQAERQERTRQSAVVGALIVVVIAVDQAAKWWAWRHFSWARINSGGDLLVGHAIGAWYAGPVTGALLDLLDSGLLSIAILVLARGRMSMPVRVLGALMIGGWSSNLLDRLGVHFWTAPGSVRGVVDFIHVAGHYYNVADFFIISCTPPFLLAATWAGVRAAMRRSAARRPRPAARAQVRARVRIPVLVGVGLALVVALGAANYGGVSAATRAPAHKMTGMRLDRART